MKLLMVSTSYPQSDQDWRGRFIANMTMGLGKRTDIALSVWAPPGKLPAQVESATSASDREWLHNLSEQGGIAHLLRNNQLKAGIAASGLLIRLKKAYSSSEADIMHINWLQNSLALGNSQTPVLISVLGSDFGLLRLPGMKPLLRSVFRRRRTILAPNADWMVDELKAAFGSVAEVYAVPFGIDESWFNLQRLPQEDGQQHWLAVTRITRNKLGDLLTWGEGLFDSKRILHLFGPMQEKVPLPAWVRYHGPTHAEDLLKNWFPRATGLITLSRHDEGRPQVMLEAMAAGLPIIASDLPAHRDIIAHQQTGWLTVSKTDLAAALELIEQSGRNKSMGDEGRAFMKQTIGTWDNCAERYVTLYRRLLK